MPVSGVQHQSKRGPIGQVKTYAGKAGELTVDSDNNRAVPHDGTSTGGWPHALASVLTSINPSGAILIPGGTTMLLVFSTASAPNYTLPLASGYMPGQRLTVWDAGGNAGSQNITITAFGSDGIYSSTGGVVATTVISVNGAASAFFSNSSGHWILESTV